MKKPICSQKDKVTTSENGIDFENFDAGLRLETISNLTGLKESFFTDVIEAQRKSINDMGCLVNSPYLHHLDASGTLIFSFSEVLKYLDFMGYKSEVDNMKQRLTMMGREDWEKDLPRKYYPKKNDLEREIRFYNNVLRAVGVDSLIEERQEEVGPSELEREGTIEGRYNSFK
jgi:hypothetical protein